MVITLVQHEQRRADLAREADAVWADLRKRHCEEVRAEMARALFDDVRPAFEAYFEKERAAS